MSGLFVACAQSLAGTFSFVSAELIPSSTDTHSTYIYSSWKRIGLSDSGGQSSVGGTIGGVSVSGAELRFTIKWTASYPGETPPSQVSGAWTSSLTRRVNTSVQITSAPSGSYPCNSQITTIINTPVASSVSYTFPGGSDVRLHSQYVGDGRSAWTIPGAAVIQTFAMAPISSTEWIGTSSIYDAFSVTWLGSASSSYCVTQASWLLANTYELMTVNGAAI